MTSKQGGENNNRKQRVPTAYNSERFSSKNLHEQNSDNVHSKCEFLLEHGQMQRTTTPQQQDANFL